MTTQLTATDLRRGLFKTLDQVIATGEPVEVQRAAGRVRLVSANTTRRLDRLRPHPGTIVGEAEELVGVTWAAAWQPLV